MSVLRGAGSAAHHVQRYAFHVRELGTFYCFILLSCGELGSLMRLFFVASGFNTCSDYFVSADSSRIRSTYEVNLNLHSSAVC